MMIEETYDPYKLRFDVEKCEWVLMLEDPEEGPGPYLDGPAVIYGDEYDE